MKAQTTPLDGLLHFKEMTWFEDHRGAFGRLYCVDSFAKVKAPFSIRQINLSRTTAKGALRGLHFQLGAAAEDKVVRCLKGRIFDVAVDLRAGSATYGKWYGVELSQQNPEALLVPKGCAHGFQALSDDVEMLYLMSNDYAPDQEGGLHYACPEVAIPWPLPVTDLSQRDAVHPCLPDLDPILLPEVAV
ncbi:MAG: dTDP-4-dehydrorhamnose 3,5-epimerase [Pseudomonadota bacterium]